MRWELLEFSYYKYQSPDNSPWSRDSFSCHNVTDPRVLLQAEIHGKKQPHIKLERIGIEKKA